MKKFLNKIRLTASLIAWRVRQFLTPSQPSGVQFANIGEGTREHGSKSFLPDSATTAIGRYLLWKIGATDGDHIAVCGLNDTPLGQSDDAADTANLDLPIAVNLFGVRPGTLRVITDGTLLNGSRCKAGANGQATLATTGDAGIFGIVLIGTDQTSAAGDVVEVQHAVPMKYSF